MYLLGKRFLLHYTRWPVEHREDTQLGNRLLPKG